MQLQLTKTKTIEISLPGNGAPKTPTDVTGVVIGSGEFCPAVRLVRKRNEWHLLSADEIPSPVDRLPDSWNNLNKITPWVLPNLFQAPSAAIAVLADDASFGQASADAIALEMTQGVSGSDIAQDSPASTSKFHVRRPEGEKKAPPQPASPAVKKKALPEMGVAIAESGRRFVLRPFGEEGFLLRASLPEYQTLWLSRLLPEGKRPTASSVQVAQSALMASVLSQPFFKTTAGTALVVFVQPTAVYFAGFKKGVPVLWRRCNGVAGEAAMRASICKTLGVEDNLVDSLLDDELIDTRPAIDPFLAPLFEQLDLSRAYLTGKHGLTLDTVYLLGLNAGVTHWTRMASDLLHMKLIAPNPFDGLVVNSKNVRVKNPHKYLLPLGAALAAMEVEEK